nr:ecdysone oxidase [Helicoverpa armigera]XP_049707820.1 ecdysone oxidase [Helicoverpa armigera]XP_049707821.1 ecdysone oxidase [Helicoverpa armigera]
MGSSTSTALISAVQVPVTFLSMLEPEGLLWPKQAELTNNTAYDYIVVGGGSAGCVVSSRLAESGKNTVFMAEAGDDPPIIALVPGLFSLLPRSKYDYDYRSTKDTYAAKGQNYYTTLQAGKMLGGSDSLNHLLHTRGVPSDFDTWAEINKDSSWKYDNILQYFIKSEKLVDDPILKKYGKYHGTSGPMGISRQPEDTQVANLLKSFAEVGNPSVLDLNAENTLGYTQPLFMIADKKRQTPAYSYLKNVKSNSNLFVSKNTRVTRIIFEDNKAVAIEAVYNGKTYVFRTNKEIIVSAGVYNTPQILQLSGIGPKEHLEKFNIKVIKDLPVGNNLIDQVSVTLVYKLESHIAFLPNLADVELDPTKVPFPVLVGSVALNKTQTDPDYQTYNLLLGQNTPFLTIACAQVFDLRDGICDQWQTEVTNRDSLYTVAALLQPKSRGTVRLASTDPSQAPLIKTGYFTNKEDLKTMVEIIKDFTSVGKTKYFKKIGAELAGLNLDVCADKKKGTDEFWECYILNHAGSPYHTVGTCPMGEVLDGQLKVKGIEGLRVVDASAMPKIPRGAPNAAVIMLAEKAADMIKSANAN